jgi:hypothetical protein
MTKHFSQYTSLQRFSIVLLLVLLFLFVVKRTSMRGDIDEYALMTVALASHLSPDIRLDDVQKAQALMPKHSAYLQLTADGIAAGREVPKPGFFLGRDNKVYAIHFFAYSALAVLPFKVLQAVGTNPFESFLLVNLSFIFILGISLFQFFDSARKATLGLVCYFLCGGINYLYWSGPETMSAAALCAAILFYVRGRYFSACVLIALAAMQNPPIILALAFLPLCRFVISYQADLSFFVNVSKQFSVRMVLALGLGTLGIVSTVGFNYWAFSVPNIIVKVATSPDLMSWQRFFSLFFDFSQGMIVGQFGIWLAILLMLGITFLAGKEKFKEVLVLLVAILFSMALAVPALTTGNWNSGAIGMMRYAFWGGMPLLFAFFYLLHENRKAQRQLLQLTLFLQLLCTISAFSYNEIKHSPLARILLRYAPNLYNPVPEVFAERTQHQDGIELAVDRYFIFEGAGGRKKVLFHAQSSASDRHLCGALALDPSIGMVSAGGGWRYLNGEIACVTEQTITSEAFSQSNLIAFNSGWSGVEHGGGVRNGVWSDGEESLITLPVAASKQVKGIKLIGHYFEGNRRTRISINGRDLGWYDLAETPTISFVPSSTALRIGLRHEYPHQPSKTPQFQDGRRLAFFLRSVTIY